MEINLKEAYMTPFSARRGYLFLHILIITLLLICVSFPVFSAEIPPARSRSDFSYENATISEDITWKGTVVIRGYLLISPQATLRIEQGTEIRFMKSLLAGQQPRLVVMGRIQCNGTADRPVLFAPNVKEPGRNDWGGILLLASEKRNLLEFCRVEGATTAIEALFSTFTARGIKISNSINGIQLKDSTANLSLLEVSHTDSALQAEDSEVDMQDGMVTDNKVGVAVSKSGLAMVGTKIMRNRQGFQAEDSRLRVSGCEFSANEIGAEIVKGEGQLLLSGFFRNRDVGLHLKGARIKVQRSLFTDNQGDAVRADDGRSIIWGSAFSGNKGNNLSNLGDEPVTAVLNWWGSNQESVITAKTRSRKPGTGQVIVTPWLDKKPSGLP